MIHVFHFAFFVYLVYIKWLLKSYWNKFSVRFSNTSISDDADLIIVK